MGWGSKLKKAVKKVTKAVTKPVTTVLKKVAPIALPLAGFALGGVGGAAIGALLPGLLKKDEGAGGGGGPPTGELNQVVGADGQPLTMPTVNSAAIEEARRKALLRRTQAGGRRSTILADKDY